MSEAVRVLVLLCVLLLACTNPRQPDLGSLLSPAGSDSCAAQVSVGSGIVHVLSVIKDGGASTCDVAGRTLQPLSTSPQVEPAQEIRGTLRCSLIGHPGGESSGRIFKVYVFADGSADSAAQKVCGQLQASADPSFDFQYT
jgi:hypothetical protein